MLRIWSCTTAITLKRKIFDRIRYALHLYQLIDLISIIPCFLPFFFPRQLILLRTLRIVSIFKLGRYSRYVHSLDQLKRVLFRKREIFGIILFFLVFVVLFSSTLLYLVEYPVQPDKFSSIPAAMWWSIMTVTTVGYGDLIPVTPVGKSIAALFTLLGVLVLALPSAILASGFIEEYRKPDPQESERKKAGSVLISHFKTLNNQGSISDEEYEYYCMMIHCLEPDR
jgi:voltage-gated potassium channel